MYAAKIHLTVLLEENDLLKLEIHIFRNASVWFHLLTLISLIA